MAKILGVLTLVGIATVGIFSIPVAAGIAIILLEWDLDW